jgi:tetratricopeptide (TPR) repeat protein
MTARRILAVAVLALGTVLTSPARAADPDPAQALFDQAIADMEAGRFDKACPAIKRSHKLEPLPGTLFALAECEAKRGALATAVQRYEESDVGT